MDYLKNLPDRVSFNDELWGFRVWCRGKGKKQVYFTAAKYGTLRKAYDAAIAFEKGLPPDTKGRPKYRVKPNSDNTTGIVGVCPNHSRCGEYLTGYRAFWSEDKKGGGRVSKTKDFSFAAWGEKAFGEARKYRKQMIEDNK